MNRLFMILLVIASLCVHRAIAQETEVSGMDEASIRATGEAYVKAFNKHDTKALASYWSPEAVYLNRVTGDQVVGREAIQQQFETLFKPQRELQLAVSVESIQFVSPNVAAEHGVATFLTPQADPEKVAYTAVYVRRDGKWLLDRVTDKATPAVQSNYEQLKQLEWMIGSWVDADENASIVTECKWTKNKSFITRSFAVSVRDRIDISGMQIVGWDADSKQVRSWTFDSEGGFSEGRWTKKGDRWFIEKTGVMADGSRASAVNTITYVDDNAFKLQSTQRSVAGELLPNVDEVLVVRQ
jgi:uncharacterized protein (TIGR02246 family)